MFNDPAYLYFGALVAAVGIGMVVLHIVHHRRHQEDDSLSDTDHRFYDQQYRRRMQTSALTVTLGALIGLCGYLRAFGESPVFASFYVIGLLLLSLWLVLLALSDAVASHVYSSQIQRRNRKLRQSLQEALNEVRRSHDISQPAIRFDEKNTGDSRS
ncbi:MAG: hypothetical protein R3C19_16605 [Planctomycetaceae bacterium]